MLSGRCAATTQSGTPCNAQPVRLSGFCWWHDPATDAERQGGRRLGGKGKSNAARAKRGYADGALTPAEVEGLIGTTLTGVLAGRVTPGQAQAVASLARAAVAVREAGEVEERLAALERHAGTDGRGRTA